MSGEDMSTELSLAHLRADRLRQDRSRRGARRPDRRGGRLRRLDAGLPRACRSSPRSPTRPTRLVAIWPLSHEASVAEYAELAHAAIDELLAAGQPPIVAGGTGLYLRAALAELDVPPAPPPGARERWERGYDGRRASGAHAAPGGARPGGGRRRPSRTTGAASSARSSSPSVGALAAPARRAGSGARTPATRPSIFGLDVPRDELDAPDRGAHARDDRARGGASEVAPRARRPALLDGAARSIGLRELGGAARATRRSSS